MTSKSSISFEGCLYKPCEMQHAYTCYDQCGFCHLSLNVITITILNIKMKHHIKCENVWNDNAIH